MRLFVGGMPGLFALVEERLAKPVAVLSAIGDGGACRRQRLQHQSGALLIIHLPLGQQHDQWLAALVADDVNL